MNKKQIEKEFEDIFLLCCNSYKNNYKDLKAVPFWIKELIVNKNMVIQCFGIDSVEYNRAMGRFELINQDEEEVTVKFYLKNETVKTKKQKVTPYTGWKNLLNKKDEEETFSWSGISGLSI